VSWLRSTDTASSYIVAIVMPTSSSAASTSGVGKILPAISSLLRPPPQHELREYGGIGLVRGKRVIDIGCGDGRMALGCAPHASEVVGVDPDPDAIRLARVKARELGVGNVEFKVGIAQELPFADEHFDVAILSWTL
jgi:2-polyprenyl-3-methyl-5-hydroxy-6-metoxy-1,4-benzoquinol methylase